MSIEEIKAIVTDKLSDSYRVKCADGSTKIVRLWKTEDGSVAILNKGKKKHGHILAMWYDHYENWASLSLVKHEEVDYYKRFVKRATDALKMLNESGLWSDIKETIEHFFSLSESEQRELVNDIVTDSYYKFYKQTYDGGKYSWVNCHEVFGSFTNKVCWKSIAWRRWEREEMSKRVAECIKNGKKFHRRWKNGYDNTVEVDEKDGYKRAWYSEEYRGCGNGWYYLMFDATHAIFYEKD